MVSAQEGLMHPDSVLKIDDFAAVKANWEPKDSGINKIAAELNIGQDSIVFVDDNPAERELVLGNMPGVEVPNIGSDVVRFPEIMDRAGFFETVSLLKDDLHRNEYYNQNVNRLQDEGKFGNHDEYLISLQMTAEIGEFNRTYIERITQLTNKTNQFNLTVKRYMQAEIEETLENPEFIGLYGKLRDKFGDNGLVSVMLGRITDFRNIHIDLWVMSCRVLNREMEFAMFNEFVGKCVKKGINVIYGYYFPSAKNGIVSDIYSRIGFNKVRETETGATVWMFKPTKKHKRITHKIEIKGLFHGNE
jgi:FkbH-like protein